jgi:penicillin-binding protein 1A
MTKKPDPKAKAKKKSSPKKLSSKKKGTSKKKAQNPKKASGLKRSGLSKFFYWSFVLFLWVLILMIPVGIYYSYDLPSVENIHKSDVGKTVMVMGRDGKLLTTYGDVYGEWLDAEEIPKNLINAVIATEDRRFFTHKGIDFRGFGRALMRNISQGKMLQGGSTISQQLAKNLFLNSERTMKRKIQELLLSFWLERKYSKLEILTLYLNKVYFGSGAYGIEAASQICFGHSARTLNLTEAAMIAGMLKSPTNYSPLRDIERAYIRTEVVLNNMVAAELLDFREAEKAKKRNLFIRDKTGSGSLHYFTDWIIEQLPDLIGPQREPIIIYTTLEAKMQDMGDLAVNQILNAQGDADRREIQGALVAMDYDGAIRAMIGGRDYGKSQFNRAAHAKRQPGSAFKMFIYLTALENGFAADDIMRDSEITLDGWSPRNYNDRFSGEISLKDAFAKSLNTVAVKLSEKVNRRNVIAMAARLGISTRVGPHPSLALGTSETYLHELTAAYGAVANGGHLVKPYGIVEIQNNQGQILYRYRPNYDVRVLSEETAAKMDEMLRYVVTSGTGRIARMPYAVAAKTGTTQNNRDAVFVGYGNGLLGGIWVGNDAAKPLKGITGGGYPATIWRNFMMRVHAGTNDRNLIGPVITPRPKPLQKIAAPAKR